MTLKNKQFLGWIALDIDGTITLDRFTIPKNVVAFIRECTQKGWRIAIATGRPLSFAMIPLKAFDFPYLLLAQNGTIAIEMPSKKVLFQRYLSTSVLRDIELAYEGIAGDFVIYSGYENNDRIYWRPKRCEPEQASYIQEISSYFNEKPIAIDSFHEIKQKSVPLVKGFGTLNEMKHIQSNLQKKSLFHLTMLRDLDVEDLYMLLITDRLASKGSSLKEAIGIYGEAKTIIAAGDDENDVSLLEVADVKIAMAHAPEHLTKVAHFIAPPTSEQGIITALQMAIKSSNL